MAKNIYISNGVAGVDADSPDQPIQGLTVHKYIQSDDGKWLAVPMSDGKPYLGYKAKELTEKEFLLWQSRIDGAKKSGSDGYKDEGGAWYAGRIGSGLSVIDSKGYSLLKKQNEQQYKDYIEKQVVANQINFKLAKLDADAIGEDHEAVFTSKHPQVNKGVKAILFAEVRAAQDKKGNQK